jgi:hypothetical protein
MDLLETSFFISRCNRNNLKKQPQYYMKIMRFEIIEQTVPGYRFNRMFGLPIFTRLRNYESLIKAH